MNYYIQLSCGSYVSKFDIFEKENFLVWAASFNYNDGCNVMNVLLSRNIKAELKAYKSLY
jgi:hypothetical protein